MELGKLLTEGKGKRVYATDDPDQAIVYFKDEAMAFHGLKRGRILGKGEVNNAISEQFFKMLEENGIPTHYLRRLDARQSLVKRCQILPALTPEAREGQMISLAMDLVEQRLRNGTASSQETTHFLRLATAKEQVERRLAEKELELKEAKRQQIQSQARIEELYSNALKAMQRYSGHDDEDEFVDEY